ncbi:hypothetical protein LXL04_019104 [Taraxacum kok-saghyz]
MQWEVPKTPTEGLEPPRLQPFDAQISSDSSCSLKHLPIPISIDLRLCDPSDLCNSIKTIFRQVAYRLLTRSTNTYSASAAATLRRPYATEVSADIAPGDSAFSEAWKTVAPTIDPPKTLIQFMEPRPPCPLNLPLISSSLTLQSSPKKSDDYKIQVDMVIVPATTGQMGILPGHVPMSFVSLFRFRLISNLSITDLFRAAAVSRAFVPATPSKSVVYSEISVALDLRQQDLRQHLVKCWIRHKATLLRPNAALCVCCNSFILL